MLEENNFKTRFNKTISKHDSTETNSKHDLKKRLQNVSTPESVIMSHWSWSLTFSSAANSAIYARSHDVEMFVELLP
jgi:hypothetical protein